MPKGKKLMSKMRIGNLVPKWEKERTPVCEWCGEEPTNWETHVLVECVALNEKIGTMRPNIAEGEQREAAKQVLNDESETNIRNIANRVAQWEEGRKRLQTEEKNEKGRQKKKTGTRQ